MGHSGMVFLHSSFLQAPCDSCAVVWTILEEQAFSIEDENRFWSNTIRFLQLCNVTKCPNVLTCNNVLYMKLVCESLEGNELTGWSCHTQSDFAKHTVDFIVDSVVLARVLWGKRCGSLGIVMQSEVNDLLKM